MAVITTVTMWNEEGRALTINAGDTALQEKLREQGYELEEKIREKLPEEAAEMSMEDIVATLKAGREYSPPEDTPEGDAALDQAAAQTIPEVGEPNPGEPPEGAPASDAKSLKKGGKK